MLLQKNIIMNENDSKNSRLLKILELVNANDFIKKLSLQEKTELGK